MRLPDVRELEVLGLVGAGACGRVYRARNAAGEPVAVKVFTESAVNPDLLEEAALRLEEGGWPAGVAEELAGDYRGKQLLRITRLFEEEGPEGPVPRSLQHRLARFPGENSWPVVQEILKALAALHDRRVAHGNLKPGNVFFDEGERVVLIDWALGNMPGVASLEYTDAVLYQPPDQLREPEGYLREKGYRRDVFAFAVLAFRLLTGAFPRCTKTFDQVAPEPGKTRREGIAANLKQVAKAVESQALVEWPDAAANPLEKAYREILDICLALDPVQRPATAAEVLARFEAAERELAAERQRDAVLDQHRAARRSAWRANVAAGVLAGAVVILAAQWRLATRDLESEESGRRADVQKLEAARVLTDAARVRAEETLESERKVLQYEKDLWLARLEESRATGDRLFAWAMEKGHRRLPPLDGRDQRLKRLELYYQDFITRTAEIAALKEERARARLQLAEVSLAKGDPKQAAQRLKDALDHAGDLPAGPDLDLRLATDRLLLALLFQERNDPETAAAFVAARMALVEVPQAEVDVDRVQQLLAVLDFHESRLLAAAGRDAEALEQLLRATRTLDRLADQRPDVAVLRSELAACFFASATILDGIGQMGDAREVRAQAAEEILRLLKDDPGNLDLRLDLAGCYGAMAEAAILSGDVAAAEATSKSAVKLLEELMRQWPDRVEVRSRLAAQRWLMAGILRDRGEQEEALKLIEEGILLVERIAVSESADPIARYRLAMLLWQKGRMRGTDGGLEEEIELESRGAELMRKLVTTDDDFVRAEQVKRSLGYLLGDLGHAAQRAGKKELAESVFAEAVAVWAALNRERPQNQEYEEGLSWSRQRLDEL